MAVAFHWPSRSEQELVATVDRDVKFCEVDTKDFLGYPRNLLVDPFVEQQIARLSKYHIHNVGDYEAGSQYPLQAFDKETIVLEFFKKLWNCPLPYAEGKDKYWGYVTANGTEGNLWAAYVGMRVLMAQHGKEPVIICNKEAHYSFDKAAALSRLSIELVDTNSDGSINIEALQKALKKHSGSPILMGVMNGTTVKEGRDDIPAVLQAIADTGRPREDFYVHVDAAFSGVFLPLVDAPAEITPGFHHDVDSISASGHKFIGTPTTCGVVVMKRDNSDIASNSVEYIASKDKTMGGSRDAHAIYELWLLIERYGTDKLRKWAYACIEAAKKMKERLEAAGLDNVLLNPHALTVYFPKPSDKLVKQYHLACQGIFAHAITAPHTLGKEFGGHDTARRFTAEYVKELEE